VRSKVSSTDPIALGSEDLTPGDVVSVARHGVRVVLTDAAWAHLRRDRHLVDVAVTEGLPVYGVTTALGDRSTFALPAEELAAFSVRTVRGRANAVGDALPAETVRAALVTRCNELSLGGSGVSPSVVELMVAMLNRGVHPVVPETGSIGSTDLCQLAHIGLVVLGEGLADVGDERLDGASALRRAGLAPVELGPKDGLVLCGSNALSAGVAALVYEDTRSLLDGAHLSASLSYEALRANTGHLDPRVQSAHRVPGQQRSAVRLRSLLRGSLLLEPTNARRLQDPVSFRSVTQVHGACWAALEFLLGPLDAELNGVPDNPLVVDSAAGILSTGNFHPAGLALALDALALAICQTATLSARRAERLLSSAFTGLPENLSPHGPERSGFAPLMKSAQALLAELRYLATPVCTDSRVVSAGAEDDSTNALLGARRDGEMLTRLRRVLAVEAVVSAQAVELAAPGGVGRGPAALLAAVRAHVPPLIEDRPCGADVEIIASRVFGPGPLADLLDGLTD
jgi:histidine ammonia-lyase